MSHYGVARDLAVYLKANDIPYEFGLPSVDAFRQDDDSKHIEVEVVNSEAAPRYMGLTMTGIKIAPSPEWLQRRLIAIGHEPEKTTWWTSRTSSFTKRVSHSTPSMPRKSRATRSSCGLVRKAPNS